jgi:hypothetical protein
MRKPVEKLQQHEIWQARMAELYPVFRPPFQNQPVATVRQAYAKLEQVILPDGTGAERCFFALHAILYVLHIAERTMMFYQQRPVTKQIELLNDYVYETIVGIIQNYAQCSDKDKITLDSVAQVIGKHAFHLPHSPVQWLPLYRLLWSDLFLDVSMRDEEYNRLYALTEKKSRDAELRNLEVAASIHFLVLKDQHDEAITRIRTEGLKPTLFFDYLRIYRRNENPELRLLWLRGLSRLMGKESAVVVSPFLQEWLSGIEAESELEAWREMAIELLPASLADLGHHYLQQKAYKHWADLHMSLGMEPWTFDHTTYASVHREHPQALLPIYHQGIETGIESKSRVGYRDAVKLMKAVRTIYLQIDRQEQWNRYYDIMMERTARLRAFQEEVEKGRLVQ